MASARPDDDPFEESTPAAASASASAPREAYQVPRSDAYQPPRDGPPRTEGGGLLEPGRGDPRPDPKNFICGDCELKQPLRAQQVRCKECSCRVLYKERTKRMVQFEAR